VCNSNRDSTVFVLGVDMRNSTFKKIFDIVQNIPVYKVDKNSTGAEAGVCTFQFRFDPTPP